MEAKLVAILTKQVAKELTNEAAYKALAVWADVEQYRGARHWFKKSALEERGHAQRITDFLVGYGRERLGVPAVDASMAEHATLADAMRSVLKVEEANTEDLNACYSEAEDGGAFEVCAWLQPMLADQVTSVSFAADVVARLERADDNMADVSLVDKWLKDQ